MRRTTIFKLIALLAIVGFLWFTQGKGKSSDTLQYQGKTIKLSKSYRDYDDYKNDLDNLTPGEAVKVQTLVATAPIAKHFSDRAALIQAVFGLKFPGYGLGSLGEKPQPDGSVLALFSIEIPKSATERYLLFRGRGGSYTLIDDFVYADSASIESVSIAGGKLEYRSMKGANVVERSPASIH